MAAGLSSVEELREMGSVRVLARTLEGVGGRMQRLDSSSTRQPVSTTESEEHSDVEDQKRLGERQGEQATSSEEGRTQARQCTVFIEHAESILRRHDPRESLLDHLVVEEAVLSRSDRDRLDVQGL